MNMNDHKVDINSDDKIIIDKNFAQNRNFKVSYSLNGAAAVLTNQFNVKADCKFEFEAITGSPFSFSQTSSGLLTTVITQYAKEYSKID